RIAFVEDSMVRVSDPTALRRIGRDRSAEGLDASSLPVENPDAKGGGLGQNDDERPGSAAIEGRRRVPSEQGQARCRADGACERPVPWRPELAVIVGNHGDRWSWAV